MRALLAALAVRLRSVVGSILDQSGDLCVGLAQRCWAAGERIARRARRDRALTIEVGERILGNVLARIDEPSPFRPTHHDHLCAYWAEHGVVVSAPRSNGVQRAVILTRPEARA